ncbi:MAG: hypothetical protein JW900_04435 [Anaerolineae bacterium]|nr:hypothetical protein [Anaerolineae bacterium]
MKGPPPKDVKLRQRRNRAPTRRTFDRGKVARKYAPRLPGLGPGRTWHPLTVAWWRDVWHSPLAEAYLEVDRHALYRLAMLVDMFWQEPSKALAAEIRLEQQAFGLTPVDRRRLEWSVEVEQEQRGRIMRAPADADAGEDPRNVLKVAFG